MLTPLTYHFKGFLFVLLAFGLFQQEGKAQCTNLNTNLPVITAPAGCSYPRAVTITNGSTGTLAATTTFSYRQVGGAIFDSILGTGSVIFMAPAPGSYTIRMIARTAGGCIDSTQTRTFTVTGGSIPRIYDGNGTPSTAPVFRNCILNPAAPNAFQVDLSSPDVLTNYTMIWGDTTANNMGAMLTAGAVVSHTYNNLNQYTIKIARDSSGCKDTVTATVYNFRPPNASILPITGGTYVGCAPLTITYRDSSVYAFRGTTLTWDFGVPGGVFVRDFTRANDTIQFTYPLSNALATCPKTISLTINNPQCGSPITNTKSGEVNVYNKSQAAITAPNPLCTPSRTYTFGNASVNNCVGSDRYFWRTADTTIGWTSSKAPVTITFPNLGNHFVQLIDSNVCGIDTTTIPIIINRPAFAGFTANPKVGCVPLSVTYTDTSIGVGNGRSWTFGAGSGIVNRTDSTFTVIYNNTGTFTTNLTVSNSQCPGNNSANASIQVYGKPAITITGAVNGCVPHTVNLNSNVANIRASSAQYLWKFKGGDTSTQKIPPPILYNTPGVDTVWLIVTDTCGTDSSFSIIRVSTLPIASFISTSVCRGDSTAFSNTSSLAMGDVITAYKWYFNGIPNDSSISSAPKYVYNTDGVFQAILRITTDKNCVDFDTAAVTVKIAPKLTIVSSPAILCDTGIVVFTGDTTGSGSPLISYQWTFGGSITDTARGKDTSYRFPSPGTYPVTYIVHNSINCATTAIKNITVNPLPDARLVASNLCLGQFAQFSDSSSVTNGNTITQWQWDFNHDGITDSTTQHPRYPFSSANTFKVTLRVGTNTNCFNTDSIDVTINPLPVVAASANTSSACKLDTFIFNNTTTGATSHYWLFGDGADSTTTSLTGMKKMYSDTGLFSVKMIATTALGCKDSTSLSVNVRPFPVASFVTNDTLSCAPKTFTFTNSSVLADNYVWQVNGNNTSVASNRPDTLIETSGQTFVVSLIATNMFGCRPDTVQQTLQTISNPVPVFTLSIDSGCGPLDVNFNNASIGATSYQWVLGNGITVNAIHTASTYSASTINDTTYQVKLIALNGPGCKDSLSKIIRVFPKPVSSFTQDQTANCGPLPVIFTNTSNHKFGGNIDSIVFRWYFGNGDTAVVKDPVETFNASVVQDTNYTIKLVATTRYGCRDTSERQLRVFPKPKANFLVNTDNGCGPLPVTFTNTSVPNDTGSISMMTFNWNFKNGITSTKQDTSARFVSNATKDTIYRVQLIAVSEHGCMDTTDKDIQVYPKPKADFITSATNGCTPFTTSFTNTSVPNDTGTIAIMSFVWDLGNGFSSITQNAGSQYVSQPLADSNYTVKLYATSEHGCKDTTQQQIVSHPLPIASFTNNKSQGCGPFSVQFTSTSTLAATYKWYFGDGDSSSLAAPPHEFQSYPLVDSVYPVKLVVRSAFGCYSDTTRGSIIGRYLPDADFISGADSICSSGSVAFINQSLGGVSSTWNFGNGSSSAVLNPVASFVGLPDRDTTYRIMLITVTPYACRDTAIKYIKVNPLPDASFNNVVAACSPNPVLLQNTSQRAVNYEWDFGDGLTSNAINPTKIFANDIALIDKNYQVLLKAYSNSGCMDTAKRTVTVYPLPLVNYTATKTPNCDTAEFNIINATQGGSTWLWKQGDQNMSSQMSPVLYFNTSQTIDTTYSLKLIATTNKGCKDSLTKVISVRPLVRAAFGSTGSSSCANLQVDFNNLSKNGLSYFWLFGDGTGSPLTTPSHKYTNTGSFDVILIAYDAFGCTDTARRSSHVNVFEVPTANFISSPPDIALPNSTVQFTNLSFVSSGSLTYQWTFGDPLSTPLNESTQQNPSHTFSDSGNFVTQLVVRSNNGCFDTTTNSVRIKPHPPQIDFTIDPPKGCSPLTVQFTNTSQFADTFEWTFDDGQKSTLRDPEITFKYPGKYGAFLRGTGPGGIGQVRKDEIIEVFGLPRANFYATPLNLILPNSTVSLVDLSSDAVAWKWLISLDGRIYFTDSSELSGYTFENEGKYTVTLVAMSKDGCLDSLTRPELVNVIKGGKAYIGNAFTPNDDGVNDRFKPYLQGVLDTDFAFEIYNRWGVLMFSTNDVNGSWDGIFSGEAATPDTYVWIVKGKYVGNHSFTEKGNVTLIR